MKIAKTKSKKKLFIGLSILLVLLVAAGGVSAYYYLKKPAQTPSTSPYGSKVNYDYNDPSSDAARKEQVPAKEKPTQTETPPPSSSSLTNVNITLTQAAQNTDSKQVVIRTIINGISSGTCKAVFSKDGQSSITKTAPVTVQASYSTCQGFNVPASAFPAGGTWKLSLTVEKDNAASTPVTKDIEVTL